MMEVMSAVRFPKIFSPRVLIRDFNRVNEFESLRGFEPTGLTLSFNCWESPIKPARYSAFSRHTKLDTGIRDSSLDYDSSINSQVTLCGIRQQSERESRYHSPHGPITDERCDSDQDVNQNYSAASWNWNSERPHDLSTSEGRGNRTCGVWVVREESQSPRSDEVSKTPREHNRQCGGRFGKGKVKVFKCPYCVITCSNRGQLLGHIRIHTGERPFVCQEPGCKKAFIRNEELTRHRRIHTGERPYVCDTCKKAFTRKDHLNKHVKIHTNTDEIFSV